MPWSNASITCRTFRPMGTGCLDGIFPPKKMGDLGISGIPENYGVIHGVSGISCCDLTRVFHKIQLFFFGAPLHLMKGGKSQAVRTL